MSFVPRALDKVGVIGCLVSTMGCASCFPAAASLGAAIGLAFLTPYEGMFIGFLLPLFAGAALLANALPWLSHRRWQRAAPGLLGPLLVLAAIAVMRISGERTGWLLYPGLALMLVVSLRDLISPSQRLGSKRARGEAVPAVSWRNPGAPR